MKIAGFFLFAAVILLAGCTQSTPAVKAAGEASAPRQTAAAATEPAAPAGRVTVHGYPVAANPGPGPYVGTAIGYPEYMGTVTVTMEIADGVITSVTVEGPDETPGYGSVAVEEMGPAMYESNSIVVDVVTGASGTSEGILHAAEKALASAGLTNDELKKIPPRVSPGRAPAPEAPPVDDLFGGGF